MVADEKITLRFVGGVYNGRSLTVGPLVLAAKWCVWFSGDRHVYDISYRTIDGKTVGVAVLEHEGGSDGTVKAV